ncbi:acyl dehydratase [Bacillus thuringiensis serovar kyushuensis]|nr:acyl dehydratase [Bacillus thuringiensis]OTZ75510.1 acyl dehydratase [Bacillus thuringiensis serovar tohokuensis]OTZ79879.1 acyl dehydratase [Bacillus thuringiensis serovar kyushuensis]
MSQELCFDKSATNNDLFGRQAHCFIEIIEKEKSTPFQRVLLKNI